MNRIVKLFSRIFKTDFKMYLIALTVLIPLINGICSERKVYITRRINPHPPVINGVYDDSVWEKGDWEASFVQHYPHEGNEATERTGFKVIYDDKHLYIIIRAWDSEPESIERRMGRRDIRGGDWVSIALDSYFDRMTAFEFTVNAAGVKSDCLISNDGRSRDASWDPIWEVKTRVDDEGWAAEMKIPFSQLRFGNKEEQVWGMQVNRYLFREDEMSQWQLIPRNASGLVNGFGELHGIKGLKAPRQIELYPYTIGRHETYKRIEGNPFATGRDGAFNGGIDGKIGITSDLTLSFTVNPDFGQVEADPSVVNLTAFETYYQERRPFFVEGRNILSFQIMGGDGEFSSDNLFYTRRVGRAPQYYPQTPEQSYVDMPEAASILAAFKLTGKTRNGLSVGVIQSLASQENAAVFSGGFTEKQTVEPFTNYLGFRMQQDFREGQSSLGFMATAVNRNIEDEALNFLHNHAYTGGVDFNHSWRNRTYAISFNSVFSYVGGTREALLRTQQSSLRYFQRPDAPHIDLDPERTSLSGHGGTFNFQKMGGGRIRASAGVTWRSPGLELNDMGFLRGADRIMQYAWMGYRITEPFTIFRNFDFSFNQWRGWDFSGENIFDGGNFGMGGQLKNYWFFRMGINRNFKSISANALRGGPAMLFPGAVNFWGSLQTDSRQKIYFTLSGSYFKRDHGNSQNYNLNGGIILNPAPAVNLSIHPRYSNTTNDLQYIATRSVTGSSRYIMGRIEQKTLALTIRLNYSLTPNLSIQFYGQPFISNGQYSDYKRITDPRAEDYSDRFRLFSESELTYDETTRQFNVEENGNETGKYSFAQPDFNFRQFRSNLVIRWEYRPGSTLFLVWSQGRTAFSPNGDLSFGRDIEMLYNTYPHNVFLMKFSYGFLF